MIQRVDISLLIPAYNAAETLAETLDSVFSQTRRLAQVIVINDGSIDATPEILSEYQQLHDNLTVISQENAGISAAYNRGIQEVKTEWFAMLSADDLLLSNYCEQMESEIERTSRKVALISSNGYYLNEEGIKSIVYKQVPWFGNTRCSIEKLFHSCFYSVGICLKTDAVRKIGGFKPGFYAEDYHLFLSLLAEGYQHAYISETLSIHRRSNQQRSSDVLSMRQSDIETLKCIQNEYKFSESVDNACRREIKRHQKNTRIRKLLYLLMGEKNTERVIANLRRE